MAWRIRRSGSPTRHAPRAVSVFARVMGAPGDRNLINFSVNAGVTLKAPLPDRDDDTFGVGFGFAKVSGGAGRAGPGYRLLQRRLRSSALVRDLHRSHLPDPGQRPGGASSRTFSTSSHPGGGIVNPNDPSQSVGNEAVFGLRSIVTF